MNSKLSLFLGVLLLTLISCSDTSEISDETSPSPEISVPENTDAQELGVSEDSDTLTDIAQNISETDITVTPWIEGLDTPWELVFLDDDTALVTQRPGVISVIENGVLQETPYWEADSRELGEGGLMGMAKDPDYETNGYLYVMYSYDAVTGNRGYTTKVVQLRENSQGIVEVQNIVLDNIPAAKYHDGGRIKFGPDGKLYITTGDATDPDLAQDLSSLAGKILRINSDGSIPTDNPFLDSLVYSYGHRNPQGITWNQEGDMFMSTHGPSGEFGLRAKDRVDYITPGTNYGWPDAYGPDQGYPNPLAYWPDTPTPPGGITFWNGSLFVATMNSEALVKLTISQVGEKYKLDSEERWLEKKYGRLRNAIVGPDGNLYVMTTNADGRGSPGNTGDIILKIELK